MYGGVAIFAICKWKLQISSLQQIIYFHNVNEKGIWNFFKNGLKGIISPENTFFQLSIKSNNIVIKLFTLLSSFLNWAMKYV